ncbi:MAG TPA: hypothetical protein VFT87_04120, partial [Candidatus Saccharimonadales bacterium]|nr:hypothetical protein [Candidatus Saccharimonadales bacterium]
IDLSTIVLDPATNANKITNYCINSQDPVGNRAKLVISGATGNQNAAQVLFDQVAAEDCDGS